MKAHVKDYDQPRVLAPVRGEILGRDSENDDECFHGVPRPDGVMRLAMMPVMCVNMDNGISKVRVTENARDPADERLLKHGVVGSINSVKLTVQERMDGLASLFFPFLS